MPLLKSWIESANSAETEFPLNNLPYGVFSVGDSDLRCGVAIGDRIIDATGLEAAGILRVDPDADVLDAPYWNDFMELGPEVWATYRDGLQVLLGDNASEEVQEACIAYSVPMADATLHMPFKVAEYTDFYAGRHHATNVGTMFRDPKNALMPNWLHIPIGYNGRASTVVVSGTPIRRPNGQLKAPGDDAPHFGPSRKLDIELELGAVVGTPNPMGQPVTAVEAYDSIFGYVLMNDWSARDIQVWEYQPLGPFQSKAFGTTVSPWVVTREALEPFRVPAPERATPLLPYLLEETPNNFDIGMEIRLTPKGKEETVISRTNYRHMYYSSAQQLVHHASSGCAMETGDLLGSGTISGPTPDSLGSLLELTWNGCDPLRIDDCERTFLEDGDNVAITGWCDGPYRIGFGACTGTILPAIDFGG